MLAKLSDKEAGAVSLCLFFISLLVNLNNYMYAQTQQL